MGRQGSGVSEDRAPQFTFPGCYQISAIKEGKVNSQDGDTRQWNFSFTCDLYDIEINDN